MKIFRLLFVGFLFVSVISALAANRAVVPVPRTNDTNWVSLHESFVKETQKGGIDILFMGDSITDRWRTKGLKVWNKYYAPRHAANYGIGGDHTQNVLWRIENGELGEHLKPKVVVLMIGTNNSNSDPADSISEAVEKIIGAIRAKSPASKILLLAIFPRNTPGDKPEQTDKIKRVNARIAKLDDGKTVRFLNINDKFLGADGKVHKDVMPDFLHLNEKGYQIWAESMESTLAELLK
jgi:lysophospholipase L1-like esterase